MPILEVASDGYTAASHEPGLGTVSECRGRQSYTINIVPGRITITPSGDGERNIAYGRTPSRSC